MMLPTGCRRGVAVLLTLVLAVPVPILGLLAPRAAQADEATERATVKALKAQALFKSGQYHVAGETFLEAYAIAPKAALLFNAARAFQEAQDLDLAMGLFERYLGLKDADDEGRADARARLQDCRAKKQQAPATTASVGTAPAAAPSSPPDGSTVRTPPPASEAPAGTVEPPPAAPYPVAAPPQAPAAGASELTELGLRDGRTDAQADATVPKWFGLGMLGIGVPLAYSLPAQPPPGRLYGQAPAYMQAYRTSYASLTQARRQKLAWYGALTTIGIVAVALLSSKQAP